MREGYSDEQLADAIMNPIYRRAKDGWEAEQLRKEKIPVHESMATIGG